MLARVWSGGWQTKARLPLSTIVYLRANRSAAMYSCINCTANMLSSRSLRIKTLLLAIPLIVILSYISFQRRQFPEWPSFVPSLHLNHNSTTHAPLTSQILPSDPHKTISTETHISVVPTPKPNYTHVQTLPTPQASNPALKISDHRIQNSTQAVQVHHIPSINAKHNTTIHSNTSTSLKHPLSHASDPLFRTRQIEFWRSFESLLTENPPDCKPPTRLGNAGMQAFVPSKELTRPKFLEMPQRSVEKMRNAHTKFVEGIKGNYSELAFITGSEGLVSTAGGDYLPVFVISLRMLRRTGTTLPVEVFMADHEEYEEHICEVVLPSLNARCVILSDTLESGQGSVRITRYQLKVFAMIFSSFESILFLDADSFPIQNPEPLFASQLFREHGFITWPDFWASSASAYFYDITGQNVPPMADRASTEAGEILLSKKTHRKSLLLAAYYNYYGPTHYYPLLSQGSPGEGDKETFLAAATVLKESFYATSEPVKPIGHVNQAGGIAASAMVQYDPIQDYDLTQKGLWRVKDPKVAEQPRPFFVHAHYPKFNPATIFDAGSPTKDASGNDQPVWTEEEITIKSFHVRLEKTFWEEIKWTACELEGDFKTWREKKNICENVTRYWKNVHDTPPSSSQRRRKERTH